MKKIIFACVHSAGRSQMAAAFLNALADSTRVHGMSAGTQPAERVHPEVLATMQEVGLDLSGAKPKLLTEDLAKEAVLLVTMGCGEACPFVPGLRRLDWELQDPKGHPAEVVRRIRDDIRTRIVELVAAEGWQRGTR